jgi:hypothetical protein
MYKVSELSNTLSSFRSLGLNFASITNSYDGFGILTYAATLSLMWPLL